MRTFLTEDLMNVPKEESAGRHDILVVDDTRESLQLLTRILLDHGYHARPALSGKLALRSVAAKKPDLILLDVKMPDMDGFEVCRRLKADERYCDIPVIFVTTLSDTEDKIKAFEAGAVEYITKPYIAEEVLARVRVHVRLRDLTVNLAQLVQARTVELAVANVQLQEELTCRKKTEDTLREKEALLNTVIQTMPIGVWLADAAGKLVMGNAAGQKIWGGARYVGKEHYGEYKGWWTDTGRRIEPEEWSLARAISRGESSLDEMIDIECFDGSRKTILNSALPIKDADQRITGAIVVNQDITGFRSKELEYVTLIQTSLDGYWVNDKEGMILHVNRALCEMLGYSQNELLTMSVMDIEAVETPDETAAHVRKVMETGRDRFITRHRCKDGSLIDVEISSQYITSLGERFYVFARDITALKQRESLITARLRISEYASNHTLAELLTRTLDEAEVLTDSGIGFFHFLEADQQTLSLLAWSTNTLQHLCKAEGVGLHYPLEKAGVWADCIHQGRTIIHNDYGGLPHKKGLPPGHAAVVREMVVPIKRGGKIVAILGVGNKKTDYLPSDAAMIQQLADIAWDINASKVMEQQIQRSEEQFRILANLAPIGIYLSDPKGNCDYVNQRWCEMAGMDLPDALGLGWVNGLHPDDRELIFNNWQQMVESNGTWGLEYRFQKPDGTVTLVYGLATPVCDSTGKIVQYVGTNMDITDRKRAEELIQRSLEEKTVMLKEIHHRVKNNMQVITSLLNLQAREITDDAVRALFEESRGRISSMALIHERLYRSEDLAHIDFREYLQSLTTDISHTFGTPGVTITVGMESVALNVNVGIPCGLIVNELVSNSLKHAFPDGRKGTIRVGITRAGEDSNILVVSDDGIGFPASIDFRNTTSLGLKLVNVLIGQIHGTVEMSVDGGTKFSITFPGGGVKAN